MSGHGVFAVTVKVMVGKSGSSVVMTSVQLLGPHEAGVKRMTTSRHESWLTVAGKGLLMSVKSGQAGAKATLATWRSHPPTLQTRIVFSASVPAQALPKSVEPVTRMWPEGALPVTLTMRVGTDGSVLTTRMVPLLAPALR